jgi:hypothetical protein
MYTALINAEATLSPKCLTVADGYKNVCVFKFVLSGRQWTPSHLARAMECACSWRGPGCYVTLLEMGVPVCERCLEEIQAIKDWYSKRHLEHIEQFGKSPIIVDLRTRRVHFKNRNVNQ